MGFDFSCIQTLWIDKNKNFIASLQKKNSPADSNNVEYYNALRIAIKNGDFKNKTKVVVVE